MLRNTFAINLIALIFHFPLPILLALMLNEIRHESFKRLNQSIVYLPHFLSWVVVASMTFFLLSTDVASSTSSSPKAARIPYPFCLIRIIFGAC
ncbi:binding-protein-dependent transport systems inner membrane component [Paenibacillus sp. JCM 10914]|nr:binding-protein-dependent transport systems inner membrane component [Paenibacillus sp. JCM 10914]